MEKFEKSYLLKKYEKYIIHITILSNALYRLTNYFTCETYYSERYFYTSCMNSTFEIMQSFLLSSYSLSHFNKSHITRR